MDLLYFEANGEDSDPLSITNPDYDFNVDGSHAIAAASSNPISKASESAMLFVFGKIFVTFIDFK